MNKIFLSGKLTRDVEFCRRQSTAVAKSAIAVNNPLSDDVASMHSYVLIEGQLLIFSDTAVAVLVEHFYLPGDQFDTTA